PESSHSRVLLVHLVHRWPALVACLLTFGLLVFDLTFTESSTDELAPVLGVKPMRVFTCIVPRFVRLRRAFAVSDKVSLYVPAFVVFLVTPLTDDPVALIVPAALTLTLIENFGPLTALAVALTLG